MSVRTVKVLKYGLWALLLVLGLRFLLPVLAPFLLAFALAAAVEPIVRKLSSGRFPRAAAAGLCVFLSLGLLCWLLYLGLARLTLELKELAAGLPALAAGLSGAAEKGRAMLESFFAPSPQTAEYISGLIDSLEDWLRALPGRLSSRLMALVPSAAAAAPGALLFAVSVLIGSYFISASYPELKDFAAMQLPPSQRERARQLWAQLRRSLGRWLRSQFILMLLCFAELSAAFWLLGVDYALLMALITALIDALPVFGVGTVLLPWAAWELLSGNVSLGLGLIISYLAAAVLRNCVQAKLIGDQLGLHPLATLVSIYAGWRLWGVAGMLVFPIIAITLKQLNDAGLLRLWKTKEAKTNDGSNIQYHSRNGDEHTGGNEYPLG